jgi:hypothetical protein
MGYNYNFLKQTYYFFENTTLVFALSPLVRTKNCAHHTRMHAYAEKDLSTDSCTHSQAILVDSCIHQAKHPKDAHFPFAMEKDSRSYYRKTTYSQCIAIQPILVVPRPSHTFD